MVDPNAYLHGKGRNEMAVIDFNYKAKNYYSPLSVYIFLPFQSRYLFNNCF